MKNKLFNYLILLTLLCAGILLVSCGEKDPAKENPALQQYARFFTAIINRDTAEVSSIFSDNCVPSKEAIFSSDPIFLSPFFHPKTAHCNYVIHSELISGNTTTIEATETYSSTAEINPGIIGDITWINRHSSYVFSNENGIWKITRFTIPAQIAAVISAGMFPGITFFVCGTEAPSNEFEMASNINPILSPEVIAGTPTSFLSTWELQIDPSSFMGGEWSIAASVEAGEHSVTFGVYSTAEAPYFENIIEHHYTSR